jgi:hypothetical protein
MAASVILLVDEDPGSYTSLPDIIADFGYRVIVAYDGPAAPGPYRRHPYRLA